MQSHNGDSELLNRLELYVRSNPDRSGFVYFTRLHPGSREIVCDGWVGEGLREALGRALDNARSAAPPGSGRPAIKK